MPNTRRPNTTYIPLTGIGGWWTQNLGLGLGVTQILALGNAKIYQHAGIFWRYLTPSPNASSFASQWNIGLTLMSYPNL